VFVLAEFCGPTEKPWVDARDSSKSPKMAALLFNILTVENLKVQTVHLLRQVSFATSAASIENDDVAYFVRSRSRVLWSLDSVDGEGRVGLAYRIR